MMIKNLEQRIVSLKIENEDKQSSNDVLLEEKSNLENELRVIRKSYDEAGSVFRNENLSLYNCCDYYNSFISFYFY